MVINNCGECPLYARCDEEGQEPFDKEGFPVSCHLPVNLINEVKIVNNSLTDDERTSNRPLWLF